MSSLHQTSACRGLMLYCNIVNMLGIQIIIFLRIALFGLTEQTSLCANGVEFRHRFNCDLKFIECEKGVYQITRSGPKLILAYSPNQWLDIQNSCAYVNYYMPDFKEGKTVIPQVKYFPNYFGQLKVELSNCSRLVMSNFSVVDFNTLELLSVQRRRIEFKAPKYLGSRLTVSVEGTGSMPEKDLKSFRPYVVRDTMLGQSMVITLPESVTPGPHFLLLRNEKGLPIASRYFNIP